MLTLWDVFGINGEEGVRGRAGEVWGRGAAAEGREGILSGVRGVRGRGGSRVIWVSERIVGTGGCGRGGAVDGIEGLARPDGGEVVVGADDARIETSHQSTVQ